MELPKIGLGTWKLRGRSGIEAIHTALTGGYRLIDSAFNYENEGIVGEAVRTSEVPREEIIVTSKLPGRHHERDHVRYTVEESVARTGLDHIDLYLIHWPLPRIDKYVEAWQGLIECRDAGLIKHIGVSNFLPEHTERLQAQTGELPTVNQIELHPYFPQLDQLAWHAERGIAVEAWCPIARAGELLEAEPVVAAAKAHDVSPVQAILAWHAAIGSVPLPKSANVERQAQNLAAVDIALTDDEVAAITALGRPDGRIADQDPATHEEF